MTVETEPELVLPKKTLQALRDLTGESRPDVALLLVLQDAVEHRLEQIEVQLEAFEHKYGMTFSEYKQRWEAEEREEDYRWEAERDYLEWEALDTRKRRLENMYSNIA